MNARQRGVGLGLILALLLPVAAVEARIWTDRSGRTIEADFVRIDGDNVIVRNKAGKEQTIPLSRLSDEDQAYAKKAQAGGGGAPSEGNPFDDGGGKTDPAPDKGDENDQDEDKDSSRSGKYPLRQWRDRFGMTAKARYIAVEGQNVVLEKNNGQRMNVPFHTLVESDQEYVERELKKAGLAHLTPSRAAPSNGADPGLAPNGQAPPQKGGRAGAAPPPGQQAPAPPPGGYGPPPGGYSTPPGGSPPPDGGYSTPPSGSPPSGGPIPGTGAGPGGSKIGGAPLAPPPNGGPPMGSPPPAGGYGSPNPGAPPGGYGAPAAPSTPGYQTPPSGSPPGGAPPGVTPPPGGYASSNPSAPPPSPSSTPDAGPDFSDPFSTRQFEVFYTCTGCKKVLPKNIKPGERCPHCRAYIAYLEAPGGKRSYAPAERVPMMLGIGVAVLVGVAVVLGVVAKVIISAVRDD